MVDTCCCGCSLKTGSILITIYYLAIALMYALLVSQGPPDHVTNLLVFLTVMFVIISILGIIGVFVENPSCIIPLMVAQLFDSLRLLFVLVFSIVVYLVSNSLRSPEGIAHRVLGYGNYIFGKFIEGYKTQWTEAIVDTPIFIVVISVKLVFLFVLDIYFFIVVLSFYVELTERQSQYPDRVTSTQQKRIQVVNPISS